MIGLRPLLALTTVAEAVTGLLLALAPSLVVRLLFGSSVEPATLARVCGLTLLTIAVACWPRWANRSNLEQQCLAMLLYNAGVGSLLAYVGFFGPTSGVLTWPAALFHFLITVSLVNAGRRSKDVPASK